MFGTLLAASVCLLAWVAVERSPTPEAAADSLRALGMLMTLVTGAFSATWWHQSADLSNRLADQELPDKDRQREANLLNGAAATSTALALIASVFSSLQWNSLEGRLAGASFLALLAISGGEIREAAAASMRQRLRARSMLGIAILVVATALFIHLHVAM